MPRRFRVLLMLAMAFAPIALLELGRHPYASWQGEHWTHAELVAYLRGQGLAVQAEPTHVGTVDGPAMMLRVEGLVWEGSGARPVAVLYARRCTSGTDGASAVAATEPNAWAWGRYLFGGDPAALRALGRVLDGARGQAANHADSSINP